MKKRMLAAALASLLLLSACGAEAAVQPPRESAPIEAAQSLPEKAPETVPLPAEKGGEAPVPVEEAPASAEEAPASAEEAPASAEEALPISQEQPQEAPQAEPVCTISISCGTLLSHMEELAEEKRELVPEDGWLLTPIETTFSEGESVFDVLQRTCRDQRLHMEFSDTPVYDSAYIEGIGNLYEFDCGALSGWKYKVNGEFPHYGCSQYVLTDGDCVEWVYTCDLGADVGSAVGENG